MAENIEIKKVDGKSFDIEAVDKEKLKAVFPQCFSEGKLDIDKLLSLCGEYIDNDFEKYKFEWKGKSECYKIAGKRSTGTLRPCVQESVDFENTNNLYIEGDNLEVLKLLQNAYYRKVKMIYIDPPYNTGNDFVYEDDFKDPLAKYKEITSQTTKSNPETMGRYHTNWLNMMYPRLRLAANLLRDDGVIFISIDDNEVTNLRKLCDEVFGEENFVDCLHWKKKKQPSFLAKHTAKMMEYVLVYAKKEDDLEKLSIENLSDATKKVINISNPESLRHFPRGVRVKLGDEGILKAGRYKIKTMEVEYKQDVVYKNGKTVNDVDVLARFSVSQEKISEFIKDNLLFITENSGLRRDVSEEERQKRKSITDLLLSEYGDNQDSDNEQKMIFGEKYFDYSKPVKLIYNFVKSILCEDSDIVLDFFSGSATTAHAVMQLNAEDGGNRQFIMVQLPELTDEKSEAYKAGYKNICEIGKERIRRAGAKILSSLIPSSQPSPLKGKGDSSSFTSSQPFPIKGKEVPSLFTSPLRGEVDTLVSGEGDKNNLLNLARNMRHNPTEAENKLWQAIRNSQLDNKFRRQHQIGEYIVDFVCLDKKLVIECDGGQHNEEVDKERTQFLNNEGFRVVRFWNNEVLSNLEGVLIKIKECLDDNTPHPNPLPQGAREFETGISLSQGKKSLDVGFKVFKLDTSNLVKWDDTPILDNNTQDLFTRMNNIVESINTDRTELDVVYEVMLKLGIPVTYKIFETQVNGRKIYSIGEDGLVLVCLDKSNGGITPEDITAMCDLAPAKIVAAENAFKDDVALSNAYYISKDKGIEIELL